MIFISKIHTLSIVKKSSAAKQTQFELFYLLKFVAHGYATYATVFD